MGACNRGEKEEEREKEREKPGGRGSTYRPTVANGPANHTPGVASGTDFQWEDLSRVQPWYSQPCGAEDGGEEEHEENGPAADTRGTRAIGFSVDGSAGKTASTEHADTLADGAPVESPATAYPIQGKDTNKGGEHVCDIVETGDPESVCRRHPGDREDGGPVDGDTGDADPLLKYLKPHDQLDTTAGVELAGIPAKEHGQVAVLSRRLPFEFDDVANILEFGFCQAVPFASKTTKDVSCFFFASDFDEPPWRFGHSPDDEEEEDEGHDLESDWEAPNEGRIHVCVE